MNFKYYVFLLSLFQSITKGDKLRIVHKSIVDDLGSSPPYDPGSNITLKCQASEGMEKCKWYHKSRGYCVFEWTFLDGKEETKRCSDQLNNRIKFIGDDKKCFMKLYNISTYDHGNWECQLQSYVPGPFDPFADRAKAVLDLKVDLSSRKGHGKYLPFIVTIGTVVGLFCLFLLFIWCYNNRKSNCRDSSTENGQPANIQEESGASLIQGRNSGSNRRSEAPPVSRVMATASASPTERDSLQEEDQLPPKYEDIENHPIVTEHSHSIIDTDAAPPPKYEDVA